MSAPLIPVGFWRRPAGPPTATDAVPRFVLDLVGRLFPGTLPVAHDAVDPSWPDHERILVLRHLANEGSLAGAEYGASMCRICGKENGNKEYSDRTYLWREGFAHYVREHAVKPPLAFIEHVKKFRTAS